MFSNVWSENTALFERLMEIHSNSPKLYYGFNVIYLGSMHLHKASCVQLPGDCLSQAAAIEVEGHAMAVGYQVATPVPLAPSADLTPGVHGGDEPTVHPKPEEGGQGERRGARLT